MYFYNITVACYRICRICTGDRVCDWESSDVRSGQSSNWRDTFASHLLVLNNVGQRLKNTKSVTNRRRQRYMRTIIISIHKYMIPYNLQSLCARDRESSKSNRHKVTRGHIRSSRIEEYNHRRRFCESLVVCTLPSELFV